MYDKNAVALKPPMGWNSWDCFAASVTEDQLLAIARYMKENLHPYGWEYVVCDAQWFQPDSDDLHRKSTIAPLITDAYARLIPTTNRFPSSADGKGFRPIADAIHAMGLKFGFHIMRGIPRQAVHQRLPILGTDTTADQIANPYSICGWNSDMYGVDATKPGAQAYYDSVFQQFAQWHVDFVKVDDICNTNLYPANPYSAAAEVEMIARAIRNCGRAMVLSLSPGPAVIEQAWHLKKHANMWRITDDFWDNWASLEAMFHRCELWQAHVGPGCWPDCDMLPLGRIGIGHGKPRDTRFTREEQRTMMTLWSLFRSPLILGGDLTQNDAWTLSLMTNDEVIAINQRGEAPCLVAKGEDWALWSSRGERGRYLAGFNLADEERTLRLPMEDLLIRDGKVRNLWEKQELGSIQDNGTVPLAAHGSFLWEIYDERA